MKLCICLDNPNTAWNTIQNTLDSCSIYKINPKKK